MKRALVALVVIVLAPSCVGGGGTIEALTSAPDRVEEVGSFRMRFEVRVGAPESGAEMQALGRMDGALDMATGRSTITLWGASDGGDSHDARPACRIRTDGDGAYVQVADEGTDDMESWSRLSADGIGGTGEEAPDQLASFVEEAEGFIAELRKAGEDVEVVDSAELRGVTTTHYRFALSQDDLEGPSGPFGIVPEDAGGPVEHDVWIDDDGLPRRILVALERGAPLPSPVLDGLESADLPTSLRVEFVLDLFDFGEPLEIEIPPDGEIEPTDARESILARCMEGAFGGRGSSSEPTPRPPSADASSTLFRVGRVADSIRGEHGSYEAVTAEALAQRLVGDLEVVEDAVVAEPGIVSFRAVGPDEIRFALYTRDGVCTGLRNLADADPGERSNFTAVREVDEGCGPRLFSLEDFGAAP